MNKFKDSVGIVSALNYNFAENENDYLELDSGEKFGPINVAYETYGKLNKEKDNAILITHALSGDAHAAGYHDKDDKKPGWWENLIGPGKAFDTNKYFIICSNVLGGCVGTTGPSSVNPSNGKIYGLDFPVVTIGDMVKVQKKLVEYLGIEKLLTVAGGSMGGMQALEWALRYPENTLSTMVIASTARLSPQSIAFDAVGRNAIIVDPNWNKGQYYGRQYPTQGLSIARMIGHITYLSDQSMHHKFGRRLQNNDNFNFDFNSEFQVESYLDYQGQSFVERFDANSYLYVTKAMDYFDVADYYGEGDLATALKRIKCRALVLSFSSDWLFPPYQSKELVNALIKAERDVSYLNIESPYGHDSFLLEYEVETDVISNFLKATYDKNKKNELKEKDIPQDKTEEEKEHKKVADRVDYSIISEWIDEKRRILDLGCGNGELLEFLIKKKNVFGMGIDWNRDRIIECISKGIPVVQQDLNQGMDNFKDNLFDYVILSQTLQVMHHPSDLMLDMLRVGKYGMVSYPNFAFYQIRLNLLLKGKMPKTKTFHYEWYNTPNIHNITIKDFRAFCEKHNIEIIEKYHIRGDSYSKDRAIPNLFAEGSVALLTAKEDNVSEGKK